MSKRDSSLPSRATLPRAQSDPTSGIESGVAAAVESLTADPAAIERMANEFFKALPGANAVSPDAALPDASAALFATPPLAPPGVGVPGVAMPVTADAPAQAAPSETAAVTSAASRYAAGIPVPSDPAGDWTSDLDPLLGFATIPDSLTDFNFLDSRLEPGSTFYFLSEPQPRAIAEATPMPLAENPRAGVNARGKPRTDPYKNYNFRPDALPDLKLPVGFFDAYSARRDFPILRQRVHGKPLVWLDNAATTQKPQAVIDRISYFYEHENSNIHRAAHALAARATDAYEARARKGAPLPQRSIRRARSSSSAARPRASISSRKSWGRRNVEQGDEIVITWLEHHANIVPWQQLCAEKGARLRVAPVDDTRQVILEEYERLLGPRTRIVSFTHVSNALGTVTPVQRDGRRWRIATARGCWSTARKPVSHMRVDVQDLDCDFFVFSGHKVFGPTGIGVVYGKPDVLDAMPPWQGGGNMIADVTFEKTVYQPPPGAVRGRHRQHRRRGRAWRGARLSSSDRPGERHAPRARTPRYATEGLLDDSGPHDDRHGARKGRRALVRARRVPHRGRRRRARIRKASPSAPGTTARSRFCAASAWRPRSAPSLALYNTSEDIDALIDAVRRFRAWSDGGRK